MRLCAATHATQQPLSLDRAVPVLNYEPAISPCHRHAAGGKGPRPCGGPASPCHTHGGAAAQTNLWKRSRQRRRLRVPPRHRLQLEGLRKRTAHGQCRADGDSGDDGRTQALSRSGGRCNAPATIPRKEAKDEVTMKQRKPHNPLACVLPAPHFRKRMVRSSKLDTRKGPWPRPR